MITSDGGSSPTARGAGHGVWSFVGPGVYEALTESFLFTNGVRSGTQQIRQDIQIGPDGYEFMSIVSSRVLSVDGNTVFVGCATSLADGPKQHALVLAQDLRLALRLIRRERWFATVAIGTVAIGIALSTAVFSVGKSKLVDALPYREAERATMVWVTNPRQGYERDVNSYPRLLAWREHSQLIEAFAG